MKVPLVSGVSGAFMGALPADSGAEGAESRPSLSPRIGISCGEDEKKE